MKYLLSEATVGEQEQVRQWLNTDTANLAYYNQLKQVWDKSRQLAAVSVTDEQEAWERFRKRLVEKKETGTPVRSVRWGWLKIAAAVIIVVGAGLMGYWLFNNGNDVKEVIVQAQQTVINDTLPDRSVVTINKRSSISYPSKFRGGARSVVLKGEAFFNVKPDKKKPFVISVNDVQVTVVGTSFNVKSMEGNTEVVVETGIVRVTKSGKTIELKAGEKLEVKTKDTVLIREEVRDRLYNYYRSKEFVCDDTPLWKLVDKLNESYDVNIVIGSPALRNERLTTTFNNESLEQVLNVISLTFNTKVTRNGDTIILELKEL